MRAKFVDTSTVALTRTAGEGTCDGTLYIVEAQDGEFTVDHYEVTTTASATAFTQAITSTVVAKTFLIHSFQVGQVGDDPLTEWIHDLQDATTIRARRGVGASTPESADIHTFSVVEAQGTEWDVQRTDAITLASVSVADAITPVNTSATAIIVTNHISKPFSIGRNDSGAGSIIDNIQCAASLVPAGASASAVQFLKRDLSIANDIIGYETVEFELVQPGKRVLVFH